MDVEEPDMERIRRHARLQATALAIVLPAVGLAAYALGAPGWIALLYVGLGLALAAVRLRLGRIRPAPAPAAPEEPAAEVVPVRRAIGYVCVPSALDPDLRERTAAVKACCDDRGLSLSAVVHDVERAGRDQRPSLAWALEQLAAESADVLVVARLRDLSSSVADLSALLSWFDSERRALIAIDLHLDTSTVVANEHERIFPSTRRGPEAARSRGSAQGRTAVADNPELQQRIATMREQGMTLQAIADALNEEGVPTLRGGAMWRPSSVQRATGYRRPSAGSRGIELPRFRPPER
jgi:DNA invertase Pin-like site-specific DNA recombinase